MKSYYRVMLGGKHEHAPVCFTGGFIGADFDIRQDLSNDLPDDFQEFNKKIRPIFLEMKPGRSKIAAGLCSSFLFMVCKGINVGDIVLCPEGKGSYLVGEITEPYSYCPEGILPHRRRVKWHEIKVSSSDMSESLRKTVFSIGTAKNISQYSDEIEILIKGKVPPQIDEINGLTVFPLEKYLEDFLVTNWHHTELGANYDIYEVDGEQVGQQYPSDTGPIDILAISKNRKELLVIELKKERASDNVVGQIQRYMGYVLEELAEPDQKVKGVIIALEDDLRIRRALKIAQGIEFYRYQVNFTLIKGS